MGLAYAQLYSFRNLQDRKVDLEAPEVFLVGENGQGKTNFIEAVYLLCLGSSFRTRKDFNLIAEGQAEAVVRGAFRPGGGLESQVAIRIVRAGGKEIKVDSKTLQDRSELLERNPSILFSPQDLELITGTPEARRRFFDQTASLFDPEYLRLLRQYRKVLRSRNLMLKKRKGELVDLYEGSLVALGLQIQSRRKSVVSEFGEILTALFQTISGLEGKLSVCYQPSWGEEASEEKARAALRAAHGRDLLFGITTTGPQRDRFSFLFRGREFLHIGSTGQLRLAALILRVAQARYTTAKSGRKPLLLFDDVLLELDSRRREAFLRHLPEYEQAFFTFLPDEGYRRYIRSKTMLYSVRGGVLEARQEA